MPEPIKVHLDLSKLKAVTAGGALPIPGLTTHSPFGEQPGDPQPGDPPPIGASTKSWIDLQDQIQAEFKEPNSRTAERLRVVLSETVGAAIKVNLLATELFEREVPSTIPESVEQSFRNDFGKFINRLSSYKATLDSLAPDSTATDSVYVGLILRRDGAGPVPDAIMPAHFADQIGILGEHSEELITDHGGRIVKTLLELGERGQDVIDKAKDLPSDARDTFDNLTDPIDRAVTTAKWVGFGVLAVASVGLAVGIGVAVSRRRREAREQAELLDTLRTTRS